MTESATFFVPNLPLLGGESATSGHRKLHFPLAGPSVLPSRHGKKRICWWLFLSKNSQVYFNILAVYSCAFLFAPQCRLHVGHRMTLNLFVISLACFSPFSFAVSELFPIFAPTRVCSEGLDGSVFDEIGRYERYLLLSNLANLTKLRRDATERPRWDYYTPTAP